MPFHSTTNKNDDVSTEPILSTTQLYRGGIAVGVVLGVAYFAYYKYNPFRGWGEEPEVEEDD